MAIVVNKPLPEFEANATGGVKVSNTSHTGQIVILYFYPKDNTPGCTRQACAFAEAYAGFREKNVAVVGVSKDSVASHVKFAEKYSLPFTLLSDPELEIIKAYDAWKEKKLYGKTAFGVVRCTYIHQ